MQLRLQRSQRVGGALGKTVFFCLDVRAEYSPEEEGNIRRYNLGGQVIYNSLAAKKHLEAANTQLDRTQAGDTGGRLAGLARGAMSMAMASLQLNISIASLGRGHHIECKDMGELLEAEETVRGACKDLTRYLEAATTFNGSEVVIEYDKGEERVHISQNAPPLLTAPAAAAPERPATMETVSPAAERPAQRPAEGPTIIDSSSWGSDSPDQGSVFDQIKLVFEEPGWSLAHRKVHILGGAGLVLILLFAIL